MVNEVQTRSWRDRRRWETARCRAKNARGRAQLFSLGEFARGNGRLGQDLTEGHRCAHEDSSPNGNPLAKQAVAAIGAQRDFRVSAKAPTPDAVA